MTSPPPPTLAAPDPVVGQRLIQAQLALERSLAAWGLSSMITGGVLMAAGRRGRGPGWTAAGRQHLAWGGVDAALAAWGRLRRGRTGPLAPEQAALAAGALRRLLLVNVVLDLAYVGVGITLLQEPERVLRSWPGTAGLLRPVGGAVLVQGAFLLAVDSAVAARLGPVGPPGKRS